MKLPNTEIFIDCNGQVNVGYSHPLGCVAVRNDEHRTLAMLKRKLKESFESLMKRLDRAIERAATYQEYFDENNA